MRTVHTWKLILCIKRILSTPVKWEKQLINQLFFLLFLFGNFV